jgi:nicotinate-nucleotide adenylyltransferase
VAASPRRIGILGGTFDPIHHGHLDVGEAAMRALALDRLFVITSNIPPHRPQANASSFHRFAMVSLAVLGRPGWRASDLELRLSAPSYTSSTLKRFRERGYAPCELFFIIGADAFADIASWRDFPAILRDAHFGVVSRPGAPVDRLRHDLSWLRTQIVYPPVDELTQMDPSIIFIDERTADVSSSAIRERCATGLSIAGMVPPGVQQHIEQHGLYTSPTPGRRKSDAPAASEASRLHGQD